MAALEAAVRGYWHLVVLQGAERSIEGARIGAGMQAWRRWRGNQWEYRAYAM